MDAGGDRRSSILSTVGDEIVSIVAPVSICMLLVVLLVAGLAPPSPALSTVATIVYSELPSDSPGTKLAGALLNSLAFVAVVVAATFLLLALFYFRCTRFLGLYTAFSALVALGLLGGEVALALLKASAFPLDGLSFVLLLANFTAVGVVAIFTGNAGIVVTQGYLVAIGVLVAYWFTRLPEWTTWMLLVAMSVYDLAAVLLPVGPLRLLVELAMSRNEQLPALVYEARPVVDHSREEEDVRRSGAASMAAVAGSSSNAPQSDCIVVNVEEGSLAMDASSPLIRGEDGSVVGRGSESSRIGGIGEAASIVAGSSSNAQQADSTVVNVEEGRLCVDASSPLIMGEDGRVAGRGDDGARGSESLRIEGIGLGSSGAIKLGLGDFIFYSVLVGRAAMYDFMTLYACYLAIIAGLGVTLVLLGLYRKALPALPVSILLGVVFYFLTRILLEAFVVGCSVHLLMF